MTGSWTIGPEYAESRTNQRCKEAIQKMQNFRDTHPPGNVDYPGALDFIFDPKGNLPDKYIGALHNVPTGDMVIVYHKTASGSRVTATDVAKWMAKPTTNVSSTASQKFSRSLEASREYTSTRGSIHLWAIQVASLRAKVS
jgi:hypothetical protein